MISVFSLLLIVTLSILITRMATVALTHTGLSREAARFQARSAFTGVGFTTRESEKVVNHPVRRRILLLLMLLGNVGIVSAITSLLLGFIGSGNHTSASVKFLILLAGVMLLWAVASSSRMDQYLSSLMSWALKRYTDIEVRDYANLLRLTGDYSVKELLVEEQDWLANQFLKDLRLRDEGISVLGLSRENGHYIGVPKGATQILSGDTLILYGRTSCVERLDRRRKGTEGNMAHDRAIQEQKEVAEKEKVEDEYSRG
jgi:hypothetical protein